ncbi:Helix-turn-helix domain-containing protein [Algoriphagus halophilus]|uniref:Helix-turn-helix domain-containing protein n=2 Tax=Algoriphagus halophilus TaxID=226505 RepID=A0A1N6HW53_9BACT|nr:Helix-turn-helix domain-containing protein [Algoriphagus halophilus]
MTNKKRIDSFAMEIHIDITKNIIEQFDRYFNLTKTENGLIPDPEIIESDVKYIEFPGELEFHHFGNASFKVPISMTSVNPVDTKWYVIHINLSKIKQEKKAGDQIIHFQRHLPIGILLYGPNLKIETQIPPNIESELATIRFSDTFLSAYFKDWQNLIDREKSLVYEDLDPILDHKLSLALSAMDEKIKCHGLVLDFVQQFFNKLKSHKKGINPGKLHPEDLKNLFKTSTLLRDPIISQIPTVEELAKMANMGQSKFKNSFKQVFGLPPMEYHNRVRMEFAAAEIQHNAKTPSEVSYLLGYSHPSNFTKAFKKYFGQLPSSFD